MTNPDEILAKLKAMRFMVLDEMHGLVESPLPQDAADLIERLTRERDALAGALAYYRDSLCENFCEGFTASICDTTLPGDCFGCHAATALATLKGTPDAKS